MEKKITVSDAVGLIQKSNGKIMTVSFIKRGDNTLRIMNCRTGVSKGVKNVKRRKRIRKNIGLITVYEMSKKSFRHINVSGIRALRLGGQQYKVV